MAESRTRPDIDGVRIACAHRRRAQRAGQVVNLRVAERRLGLVLVNEPVTQPARIATGKAKKVGRTAAATRNWTLGGFGTARSWCRR